MTNIPHQVKSSDVHVNTVCGYLTNEEIQHLSANSVVYFYVPHVIFSIINGHANSYQRINNFYYVFSFSIPFNWDMLCGVLLAYYVTFTCIEYSNTVVCSVVQYAGINNNKLSG